MAAPVRLHPVVDVQREGAFDLVLMSVAAVVVGLALGGAPTWGDLGWVAGLGAWSVVLERWLPWAARVPRGARSVPAPPAGAVLRRRRVPRPVASGLALVSTGIYVWGLLEAVPSEGFPEVLVGIALGLTLVTLWAWVRAVRWEREHGRRLYRLGGFGSARFVAEP